MTHHRTFALLIAGSSLFAAQAAAQQAVPQAPEVEVIGIAPGDLLNLRATASAGAIVIARFENGAVLNNLGCVDVAGASWCKVQSVEDPKLMGWAAARYLLDWGAEEGADENAQAPVEE